MLRVPQYSAQNDRAEYLAVRGTPPTPPPRSTLSTQKSSILLNVIDESRRGELANVFTHAIGVALALAALAVLVTLASLHGSPRQIVSYSVYGVTLVLLYTTSTAYHGIRLPRARRLLRILDHAAIYLLIAGTYTPFALISLRGAWGWSLFGLIWALAAIGVVFKVFFIGRFPRTSVVVYLAM